MKLEGSCHCGAVRFTVESHEPVPYQRCYCSICRKTAGTGGFAINLGADRRTLQLTGGEALGVYRAVVDGERSEARRHFCTACGTALYLWDPRWPDLVHPHAGCIDTPLPAPPVRTHMMVDSRAAWVDVDVQEGDACFAAYPDRSLRAWHEAHHEPGEH